jgi:hypothetical protein
LGTSKSVQFWEVIEYVNTESGRHVSASKQVFTKKHTPLCSPLPPLWPSHERGSPVHDC